MHLRHLIFYYEPLIPPCPLWVLQRNTKVLIYFILAKLKDSPSTNIGVLIIRLRLQTEEISKKLKVGIDSEEGFTHMNKESNLGESFRSQVDKLDPVKVENPTEKF
jgi:hypothetical protein